MMINELRQLNQVELLPNYTRDKGIFWHENYTYNNQEL
jgi:hypothetical protein